MSVERLKIDELKRIEKQITTVLKLWRKLQKDFADLQIQHSKLQDEYQHAIGKNAEILAAQDKTHMEALNGLEQQWHSRYEQDIAALNQQLQTVKQQHEQDLQQQQKENQQRLDQLHQELTQEKNIKSALIARVRGVGHE